MEQDDRPALTPAMIEAGVDAFVTWFGLPDNADCLLGMPEPALLKVLPIVMFEAIIQAGPVSVKNALIRAASAEI